MKVRVWAILVITPLLFASDEGQLATALKAQSAFDRVELAARPGIADTGACIQSQAAALAVSSPEELSLLHYRKGYCTFAGATASRDLHEYGAAVAEFDKAIEAWPARTRKNTRHAEPEPVSAALRVFAGIARLQAAGEGALPNGARQEIATALEWPACKSNLMSISFCGELLAAGAQWLGWMDLLNNQLGEAANHFSASPDSGWSAWVEGRRAFDSRRYAEAAAHYAKAVDEWKRIWQGDGATFLQGLGPRPQYAAALADWGAAQALAGDLKGAIAALDASIQADSGSAHALYLRARAKELAGQKDGALADYNLASRTAFAAAQNLASGEAHLYRGIVLYRRRDFARAEDEFSSALNFEMTGALRPDARAWRQLAAVAGGDCGTARESLGAALASVSPFFPRDEARSLATGCDGAAVR